jgi:bile acid:Na+ symporter, BASS family
MIYGKLLKLLKEWSLPAAMIVGALFYRYTSLLAPLIPYLIFVMLLLTFCRLSPKEVRLNRLHVWLLAIQLVGAVGVYLVLGLLDEVVAQSTMVCVLAPTATAAAVITGLLGGNIAFLTSYVIFCSVGVAVAAPLLFSFMGAQTEVPFFTSVTRIATEVGPVLIIPLLTAWGLYFFLPAVHRKLTTWSIGSYYLWVIALTVVTGRTTLFLVSQQDPDYRTEMGIALGALVVCVAQFALGRFLGRRYNNDAVSAGQGLGQKNTILAIWMAQVYLHPLASIGPAAYIVWQNGINSFQLWRYRRGQRRRTSSSESSSASSDAADSEGSD